MREAEMLKRARDKLLRGWTQRRMWTGAGETRAYCAVGAIYASTRDHNLMASARHRLSRLAGVEIMSWNDQPERKQREVIGLFERAIVEARSDQESQEVS